MDQKIKIEEAIRAHSRWFVRLRTAIEIGSSDFDPKVVKTDNHCEFGKWLYNEFPEELKSNPLYKEIKELHAGFHVNAAKILEMALDKDKETALEMLKPSSDFRKSSLTLVTKLNHLKSLLK